jgi:hypothetical protein
MNTASDSLGRPILPAATGDSLNAWWRALATLGPTPWKWASLIAVFGIVLDCTFSIADMPPSTSRSTMFQVAAFAAVSWVLNVLIGVCAWAVADRVEAPASSRPRRLVMALFMMEVLQTLVGIVVRIALIGHLEPCQIHVCETMDMSKIPVWLFSLEQTGPTLIFGGLLFAWLEIRRRNREIEQRLIASQQERARLQRVNFESRLAAMQAHVDPQFLFESLADVQAEYEVQTSRGAALLDRLIVYLRAALPSLRSGGSDLGVEAELVGAWLEVVAARRGGRPAVRLDVPLDCRDAPFGATMLLPLAQWACGDLANAPREVSLRVRRSGPGGLMIQATLQVAPPPPQAAADDVPARVRERLKALYGEAADLTVDGSMSNASLIIVVHWPDERSDRDRC